MPFNVNHNYLPYVWAVGYIKNLEKENMKEMTLKKQIENKERERERESKSEQITDKN